MLRRTGYLIDADRSTLSFDPEALEGRLLTGYPIETYLKAKRGQIFEIDDLI
jgi:hypothetical protein